MCPYQKCTSVLNMRTFLTDYAGRRSERVKSEKWLPVENVGHIDLIFYVHIPWPCAIYEVSMTWRTVHRGHNDDTNANDGNDETQRTIHY